MALAAAFGTRDSARKQKALFISINRKESALRPITGAI
jgi:hypothetical protein